LGKMLSCMVKPKYLQPYLNVLNRPLMTKCFFFDVYWSVHRCDSQWNEEPTRCYLMLFITHMICSTCFGHLYAHHQELTIIYHCSPHGTSASWYIIVSSWWWAQRCPKHVEHIISVTKSTK
jgi:hypothetical protein